MRSRSVREVNDSDKVQEIFQKPVLTDSELGQPKCFGNLSFMWVQGHDSLSLLCGRVDYEDAVNQIQ